jgi:hypothetical protein
VADAGHAREQAREILSQRRFHASDVPRPFEKPLHWLGQRLEDVGNWFARAFDGLDAVLPGGGWVVWLLLAGVVAALAVVLARSAVRRRAVAGYGGGGAQRRRDVDPAELERAAAEAERDGDFERAVRLRFRAGVVRLERRHVLTPGGLRTTGEIGAVLGSETYDELGADFDAIAYGGRPAAAEDAAAAREGWTAVLRP